MLADLDKRLDGNAQSIANLRSYAERVGDPEEQQRVAERVKDLLLTRRDLEAKRDETARHYATWRQQQDGLQRTLDWVAQAGRNLAAFTFAQRRETLLTLRAEVKLYRADHEPRAEMTVYLPLFGAQALEMPGLAVEHSDESTLLLREDLA